MARYARQITVEFDGDIGRALSAAGAKVQVGMGTIARRVAANALAGAKQRGGSFGGVHAHVLPGMALLAAGNVIRLDRRRYPMIMGAEFGGGRRSTTRQFPSWRGADRDAGYMLYPALRAEERNIQSTVVKLIDEAL